MELSRGQRVVLWLLDLACRAREAAYIVAPTDERHAAWGRAEDDLVAHRNLYAPYPPDVDIDDGGPMPAEWERPESER